MRTGVESGGTNLQQASLKWSRGTEVGFLDFEEDSSTLSRSLIAMKRCS
jgi:hypothetical protein